MDKIVSLAKRRGFVFPGSEIYGGLSNSYDYGPLGVELKRNIEQLWWDRFVHRRDDMVGVDAAVIMNPKVWEASGHLENFTDPLIECKKCHSRYRDSDFYEPNDLTNLRKDLQKQPPKSKPLSAGFMNEVAARMNEILEKRISEKGCIKCNNKNPKDFTEERQFNLMLRAHLGPTEEKANKVYFRPEIAQAMFVNFKLIQETMRKKLPFGIASQGKSFRNEITPGNFIFRTREFNLMEFEYFIEEKDWEKWFEYWRKEMKEWLTKDLGVNYKKVHEVEISPEERAHYSKRTIDFEYEYPFGQKELYGLAYRTDFDLKNHFKDAPYRDPDTGKEFFPHVIEPTFGIDRSVLVTLLEAYHEDKDRVVLKLPPKLAPYKAAVFPLLANKPELVKLARKIYDDLRQKFTVAWDDRGNIGKRYYSQDEIGTPFCITVDFESLEKEDVTVRVRDTAKQERIPIKKLSETLNSKLER